MNKKIIFTGLMLMMAAVFATECQIKGKKGGWYFEVDQQRFELKGVGCAYGNGADGTDYFTLANELGANTVRTWGAGQGNKKYLDEALKHGLKVDAGIWLPHCNWQKKKVFSYINNREKLEQIEKETLDYIRQYKNHPAIILWNLGNEVLFFSDDKSEKIAFCKFLESLIQKVRQIDSKHPVLYTCAGASNLHYLKEYVPSLDLIGFNTYAGIEYIHQEWEKLNFSIPYIITEFGPLGPWDRPKDQFNKSIDEADYEKSFHYQLVMEEVPSFRGNCLGVFAFHLGDTTQESLSWWNLTQGKYKRESFHVIKKFYTGLALKNQPPLCTGLEMDKLEVKPGEKIIATITARDRENDALKYNILISTANEDIMEHRPNSIIPVKSAINGNIIEFSAPLKPDIYKLHAFVYDTDSNVSVRTMAFRVKAG